MNRTVTWDLDRLKVLKEAYATATARHHRTNDAFRFKLEGLGEVEMTIGYAKYTIEYLEGEFARNPMRAAPRNDEGMEGQ